jgi:hypothetical protein
METLKKLFTNLMKDRNKVSNLREVMDIKIDYSPIPFNFNNVGTYKR